MRKFFVLLTILLVSYSVKSQISVKEGSFKEAEQFFTMKDDMTDDNYTPFAVIKVKTENMTDSQVEQLGFSGNALTYIDAEYHDTEVWLYITYLAPYLKITHPDLSSTEFTIPYDMQPLHGYELVLLNGAINRTGGGNGIITVNTNPPGAQVFLNGIKVSDTTPYTNNIIATGHYELTVTHKNYNNATQQIDIIANKETTINIDMELGFGKINIDSYPTGATVFIDNVKKGTTPLIINDILVGTHTVRFEKDEFDVVEYDFVLEEDNEFVTTQRLVNTKIVKTYKVKDVEFSMVLVKGGSAMNDFYIGEFEVTQKLWKAVMGKNPSNNKGSNHPVELVSWDECQAFIKKLNKKTKADFRLPTEAEWEYAAKGGKWSNGYIYSGSNRIDDVACYGGNSGGYLVNNNNPRRQEDYFKMTRHHYEVGSYIPNELGIYDMSGNVFELCVDDHDGRHAAKGGSFSSESKMCKIESWAKIKPDEKYKDVGFRLVIQ